MKTNVLYISYDGMTDPLGQSQVIPYLQGLTAEGYSFTLISFEKPDRYAKYGTQIADLLKNSNIDWVPLTYTKSPPVLSTLYDYRRMKQKAFELHSHKNFQLVHCRSYIAAMAGLEMKKKLGLKFVFDMRGFYADERVDGGIWNLSNPVYKQVYDFFKRREKEFLSEADYTISLTEAGEREIHSWKTIRHQPIPIQVIPCCADLKTFASNNVDTKLTEQLRQTLGIKESDFVLSYLGSIGTWYLPDEMMDFFKTLLTERPDAKFLFITNEAPEVLLQLADAKNIPRELLIIKPAARNEVPSYLALSNWSLFFIKPVFSKSASSPTKQGEIMGMGIPHVCNAGVGDVESIVRNTKSGYVVKEFSNAEYLRVIKLILTSKPLYNDIVNGAENYYSLEKGVKRYNEVYQKLLSSAG